MATLFASSSPPPMKKSRVRVSSTISIHLLFILFNISVATSRSSSSSSSSSFRISYTEHCNSIFPESVPNAQSLSSAESLQLQNGYYLGGDEIPGKIPKSSFNFPKAFSFRTQNLYKTLTDGVFEVKARLIFPGGNTYPFLGNLTFGRLVDGRFHTRPPRFPLRRGGGSFNLQGFWSESDGKLCMVGSGSGYSKEGNLLDLSAVFKLNYPKNSTIFTSLVTGTLESLNASDNSNYFEPISLLALIRKSYNYTLISKENEYGCSGADDGGERLSPNLAPSRGICPILSRSANEFKLEYGSDCEAAKNCSPLGFLPGFMSFSAIQCADEGRLRLVMGFSSSNYYEYNPPLVPNTTLVGEGVWDREKNRLCLVACRILNFSDSLVNASVGDCSVRLSLMFPANLSIRNRSSVVGQIWSNRTMNESGYFDRIVYRSSDNKMVGVPGLKYEYTEIGSAMRSCSTKKVARNKGKRYPNGFSYDMRFDISVKNNRGKWAWGYSVPLSVGGQFYEHSFSHLPIGMPPESAVHDQVNANHSGLLNVSYRISFTAPLDFMLGDGLSSTNMSSRPIEISAEGIYDTETGGLCMVGCRYLGSNRQKSAKNDTMDCEILISVQFPPLNAKSREFVKGTIESKRGKLDPLYFKHLELSSTGIYTSVAEESVWRMDLEITMVLISNTLSCVFVGLQLFYMKKHPDVLPSVSLVMLVILTFGHMIPLLLNFEALFLANRNRQNVLIGSGGWLEVNEVIVRVVTMVAFLLQFRLLQLTWSTRLGDENQKGLWVAEKKALYVSLPLYLVGGLIAWIMHWWSNSYQVPQLHGRFIGGYQRHSLWGDTRSYAGLVLDGFLLPQILLNIFWNSKDKALSRAFYVGTTVVRLLPHAYDLYRAHSYASYLNVSYIYANPGGDFFSTSWDVIIPCGGLLFAVLIFLQQRFGGRCILPQRFREAILYEKVPVANGE